MLTIVVAALLSAPTDAEIDLALDAYQTCLVNTARTLHVRDPKLNPERLIAAASPTCEGQAAKTVAIAKAKYSQRDSNGNVEAKANLAPVWSAIIEDLKSAAVLRYRTIVRMESGQAMPEKRR